MLRRIDLRGFWFISQDLSQDARRHKPRLAPVLQFTSFNIIYSFKTSIYDTICHLGLTRFWCLLLIIGGFLESPSKGLDLISSILGRPIIFPPGCRSIFPGLLGWLFWGNLSLGLSTECCHLQAQNPKTVG